MKSEQEWTPESVKALVGYDIGGSGVIARAHNNALAAERSTHMAQLVACDAVNADLVKQLAAEQEKVRLLTKAMAQLAIQPLMEKISEPPPLHTKD